MSLVESLTTIVNIPSVTGDEDALCTWLHKRYKNVFPTQRLGNSLIVGAASHGRPFTVLYGHTDTVPVQGDPTAKIAGDRLVGLGASDMKAGLAVMMELLDDRIADTKDDLVCVFYDAEEGPARNNGLEAVLENAAWLIDAEMSIVLEPTDLNLELGCNGVVNADVVFVGSTSHSARPWLGENAITKAGLWLAELDAREPEPFDIDGLVYREVFSVTQAHGGIANNIIPGEFTINLNHRFPPVFTTEQAETRLQAVAEKADRVTIRDTAPAGGVDLAHSGVQRLDRLIGRERMAKQGWTDVARLTSRGAVAVNYGPGDVSQAHQVGESVPIANLTIAYDVLNTYLTG
ncbi:MAG: succinyl-diaminopimelate desuccinylase [Proteobacteria bacterium]|nr:succinyl-diaminopimelate desuccinylase [Pseudomonadota bacterium]